MFATISLYRLAPIFEREFIVAWTSFAEELKVMGYADMARLHKESRITYLSYVHWKSAADYERIKSHAVEDLNPLLDRLAGYCNSIHDLHRMEVIENQLTK